MENRENNATELAPIDRAKQAVRFDETKAKLAELAEKSAPLVEITNVAGYQQIHAARMELKNTRVEITKRSKEARDDANKLSAAVIAAEKELVGIIQPEEARLQALQDAWDAAREKERQDKIEAERARIDAIQKRIATIRNAPSARAAWSAAQLLESVERLAALEIGQDFAEFRADAETAKGDTLAALRELADQAATREAEEAARVEAQRIESERLASERAELDRRAAEIAEQQRAADAERAEADRIAQADRDRLAAAQREQMEADAAEARRRQAALDEQAAEQRKEADRLAGIEREAEAKRQAEQRAELEHQKAEQAERQWQEYQARAEREAATERVRAAAEIMLAALIEAEAYIAIADKTVPGTKPLATVRAAIAEANKK